MINHTEGGLTTGLVSSAERASAKDNTLPASAAQSLCGGSGLLPSPSPSPAGAPSASVRAEVRRLLGILSEDEFRALMGFGPQTLVQWRTKGIGPDYCKCGKTVFYRLEDIHTWMKNCLVVTDHSGSDHSGSDH